MTFPSPLYNVRRPNGSLIERDCTASQAAHVILGYDGADWCVIREPRYPGLWALRTRRHSGLKWRQTYVNGTYLVVAADDEDDATNGLLEAVLHHNWPSWAYAIRADEDTIEG